MLVASAVAAIALGSLGETALAAAPANDDFSARQVLNPTLPASLTTSNVDATLEPGEPTHPGFVPAGHSIWFEWEPAATQLVTVDTCGSEPDTILTVYAGSDLGSLVELASNRFGFGPNCEYRGSEITFKAIAGTKYQLQVDGNAYHATGTPAPSGEGEINLRLQAQEPPSNDDLADATELTGTSTMNIPAGNWGATKEPGEPTHRGKGAGSSVWFKWTAPRTNGVFLQACNGPIPSQTVIAAYTGSSVGSLSLATAFDSEPDCRYSFTATVGVTYWIAVDGMASSLTGAGAMADPGLSLSMFPGYDDFESPHEFSHANFLAIPFSNRAATKQPGEPAHAGNPGGASVWFSWTAPITGSARFSACAATFRTLTAVYVGSQLGALQPIASSDNVISPGCWAGTQPARLGFNIDAGVEYRIAVDGFRGATGGFNVEMSTSSERLPLPAVAPDTRIARRNIRHRKGVARFVLAASEPGTSFICRLDARAWKACGPVVRYRKLKPGKHVFRSKAIGEEGLIDASPAVLRFWIRRAAS